jgi:hypothetical protein
MDNYSGQFSNTMRVKYLFTHTCGSLPLNKCGVSDDKTGQWGQLKDWDKEKKKLHLFYFTWTFGKLIDNYKKKLNWKYVHIYFGFQFMSGTLDIS